MKLLILFHSLDKLAGGVENRISTLEMNLPKNVDREFLLFKDNISLPHIGKINIIDFINIPKIILQYKSKLKLFAFFFGFINLFYRIYKTRQFLKNNNFTTILAVDDYFSLITILATLGMNIKIVSSVRNSWERLYNGTMIHLLPDIMYKKVLPKLMNKYVYKVHCVSECLANQLNEKYNINNTISIYNIFNIEDIKRLSKEPINLNYKYIINIGHLNKQKNQKDLIMAYSIIKKEGFQEKLLIVGDGNEKSNLIKLAIKLNLEDDVIFVGKQDNPYKYLQKATLYVASSLYEGLPAVLVESLILNIPIVSYNFQCGANELTNNVTKLNYNSLAIKMQEILRNNKLHQKSILDGQILLSKKFITKEILKRWIEILCIK